jgi:hypothetical protein
VVVFVALLLWSGSSALTYDDAATRAVCATPNRPPPERQVRTIRFRGGEGGSGRFEPYHYEEVR